MTDAPLDILSPKNDFVFKQIFGDAKNIDPLAAFLQAALELPEEEFEDLAIVDPNLNSEYDGDKHCIFGGKGCGHGKSIRKIDGTVRRRGDPVQG